MSQILLQDCSWRLRNFKARADDNHATPVHLSFKGQHWFPNVFKCISSPGKVFRLSSNWTSCSTACASPRLFLWVLILRSYFPGGRLNALAAPLRGSILETASRHRLGRGLQGYLILFAPHAFVPECQECASYMPSPLVFPMISTDVTPTPWVLVTSHIL